MSKRHMTAGGGERGVSLVEVLVAVAVLAIALIAVFRALDNQAHNTATLSQRIFAHWVALNALEETRLRGLPEGRETKGAVELGGVAWKVTMRRDAVPLGLVRLEVSASGEGRSGAVLVGFLPLEDRE